MPTIILETVFRNLFSQLERVREKTLKITADTFEYLNLETGQFLSGFWSKHEREMCCLGEISLVTVAVWRILDWGLLFHI